MSESEVENDDVTVNARDSLHYLHNQLYLFHENGLISIPNRLHVSRKSKPECVRSVSRLFQSLFTEFMVSGETMLHKKLSKLSTPRLSVYFCPLRISKRFRAKFQAASECLFKVATI